MRRSFVALGVLAAVASIFYFLNIEKSQIKHQQISIKQVVDSVKEEVPEPKKLYGIVVDNLDILEEKVKRNQNISEILAPFNVKPAKIYQLAKVSKEIFDVRKLATNKKYTLIYKADSVPEAKALIYEPNPIDYVVFNLEDSISVELKKRDVKVVEKMVGGEIQFSLSETMENLNMSHQLTNQFVDIFAWQIDFQHLQKGDRFKLIYEDKLVDEKSVGIGNIKGIHFEHFENDYFAIAYDQGNGLEYFDEEGQSLQKALLKYPIKFTRISSRYSGRRFHPVQKRWKAHRGIDFAAPRGTEIRSVGDGIVLEARYGRYNGNFVKIRHNSTYTTQYLHMSKIAKGITQGTKVKQGQPIGYVGSTGLANGPHLCYRFWKNGVQIDALKVDLPSASPVNEKDIVKFQSTKDRIIKLLNDIDYEDKVVPLLAQSEVKYPNAY
ncbi:peptidoglycan DD-metalloendopeptidase family protein [Fulvivirgaceae bacterium BMA12]|uniref:Peptidoglycan DD-metalloendopeptidase family protein n=1 Tax=Agaribacillus aureus TaxID=3051825 RepID=A0ABT8LFI6_9BACT|nr:peptidoglycan DD-metalloendopeptidase family protein [Fulvivirgaceae bacterium BMA12]